MSIKLNKKEEAKVVSMVNELLADDGHEFSESISQEFDLDEFHIEITVSKNKD